MGFNSGFKGLRKRKIKSIRTGRRNILEKGLAGRGTEEVETEYKKLLLYFVPYCLLPYNINLE